MLDYKLNGLIKDPKDERDFLFKSSDVLLETTTIPDRIDHTSMMTPVKDQGMKGACVAFATCALKEWQETIEHKAEVEAGKKYNRDNKVYDLSEQWIYHNCKKIDAWPGQDGTSIRYAMKVLQKIGVPCEKGWQYDDRIVGDPEIWAGMVARWNKIGTYQRVSTLTDLRVALSKSPVPIGVLVFREMLTAGGDGSVKDPARPSEVFGGHAVCCVGYNDAAKIIKFKNSWSTAWGRSGYGYISYNYINRYMLDAWSCNDISVTRDMLRGKVEDIV